MRQAICRLQSVSPYSQSRHFDTEDVPLQKGETKDAYERRTWKNKCHAHKGEVYIPPMAFSATIKSAAKRMGRQIPGKGKATYTKFFEAGVFVVDRIMLGIQQDDVDPEKVWANSDGVRGSGKRVTRIFPTIQNWEVTVPFIINADEINEAIFTETLAYAGNLVGIGRFRPENLGYFGRFRVLDVDWKED